jgi:hypothetical protein
MNVEIGAEAALFPEKEYISGIFFAVCRSTFLYMGLAPGVQRKHFSEYSTVCVFPSSPSEALERPTYGCQLWRGQCEPRIHK